MHGEDLIPLFQLCDAKRESPALLGHTGKFYGAAMNTVPDVEDAALYHGPGGPWYVMLAQQRYKYGRTLIHGETEELCNLEWNPDEIHNLVDES